MTPIKQRTIVPSFDFAKGLEILEPFLKRYGFEFDNYEEEKSLSGEFVSVFYKNIRKKFIIIYRPFIRQVIYQHDDLQISHDFYLDQLGFIDKKELLNFQQSGNLSSFKHILDDFEFLVADFFKGDCTKLREFSKLQSNVESIYNEKLREGYNVKFDNLRIGQARQEFTKKDFKNSLETYRTVERKNLFHDIDKKVIEYCEQQLLKKGKN